MPLMKSPDTYLHTAIEYAELIAADEDGFIASRYVRLACEKFLVDLNNDAADFPFVFDPQKAWRACAFLEAMPHTKGEWAARREKIKLQPWQIFIVANIFGWVRKSDGARRYRRVLVMVPRKNGKSLLAAGIGNYMFLIDGEHGAEVYSGATSLEQAKEVFTPAKLMLQKTPALRAKYDIEIQARTMTVPANGSRFTPLIGKPGDGSSPSCAIIDEYHEHSGPELYETMRTGMGARKQPLLLAISTAGTSMDSPCFHAVVEAQKMLDGIVEDQGLFAVLHGLDPEDDWMDEAVLEKANPNVGVSVSLDWLKSELASVKINPRRASHFRTKHQNAWVGARSQFFNMASWQNAADTTLKIDNLEGTQFWMALDLAAKQDLSACVMLFKLDDGRFATFGHYFLPEDALNGPNGDNYRMWAEQQGHITITDGAMVDQDRIYDYIDAQLNRFSVNTILYDSWGSHALIARLQARSAPCTEFPQNVKNFSEPMKVLAGWIDDGQLIHDGDECLAWMMSNVESRIDSQDRVYPRRPSREAKIDGAVALVMCAGGALADEAATYRDTEVNFAVF